MNRLILSFFAGLLSISSVFFLGDYVKAASPWDDVIELSPTVQVSVPNVNDGEPVDVTTDWSSYIRDEDLPIFGAGSCNSTEAEIRQSFVNATTNSTGSWAVSQFVINQIQEQRVHVFWSESGDATIQPINPQANPSFVVNNFDYSGFLFMHQPSQSVRFQCSNATTFATGSGGSTRLMPFLSTMPVEYPDGYEGEEVPETVSPPPRDIAPAIVYTVADLHLEAAYLQNVDDRHPYTLVCWRLYNENDDQIDQYCGENPYADRGVLYQYDFDVYGTYYLVTSLHAGPPPSAPLPPNVLNTVTTLIVDGSTYTGVTDSTQCSFEDGAYRCEKPLYEDCSIYENMIDAFACHVRNFGIWLRELFLWLFVPSTQWFANYFDNFRSFMEEKLGMIFFPIGFLIDLFGSMANNAINTSCSVNPDGQIFGASLDINVCRLEQSAGNIANAIFLVMRSVVVIYLIFALYRKYLEVVKS